jgi:hypothetical protein
MQCNSMKCNAIATKNDTEASYVCKTNCNEKEQLKTNQNRNEKIIKEYLSH